MAVPITVASVPPFDLHGEQNSVAHQWEKWLKSFSIFAGCKSDKQKRQPLLHSTGADVQDVFHTFTETGTDHKTAVDKLNQYFAPRKNQHTIVTLFDKKNRRKVRPSSNSSQGFDSWQSFAIFPQKASTVSFKSKS